MRTAFIEELIIQARHNPRLFLVVGDLGYSVIEPFAAEFPDRYLNAGVAEQNMTGLAAGLASEGYHVFTYSIANFPTLRCLEQIRNDICYHDLPVTVVAVGAGLSYGNLGYSHHAVQDIAILRTLPGMHILSPADPGEARAAVQWLSANPRPSYLRLGKAGEKQLYTAGPLSQDPIVVRHGNSDVALVATGSVLEVALETAIQETLEGRTSPTIISMPWVHPTTVGMKKVFGQFKTVICIEEHIIEGGIREMLTSILPRTIEVAGVSLRSEAAVTVGSQKFLRTMEGLSVKAVQELLAERAGEGFGL